MQRFKEEAREAFDSDRADEIMEIDVTPEQALKILDNVAANSLMNLKDTQLTRQAVAVLQKAMEDAKKADEP